MGFDSTVKIGSVMILCMQGLHRCYKQWAIPSTPQQCCMFRMGHGFYLGNARAQYGDGKYQQLARRDPTACAQTGLTGGVRVRLMRRSREL